MRCARDAPARQNGSPLAECPLAENRGAKRLHSRHPPYRRPATGASASVGGAAYRLTQQIPAVQSLAVKLGSPQRPTGAAGT